jgi:L-2-hydroxyglutarate oxidase LhgO
MWQECEVLIIGGGITGLTIASELVKQGIGNILILEKEPEVGLHASGRNSGVLHAGIYYTPDSLKARFCIEGNRLMKQYCKGRGLTLLETGKVIVTKNASELAGLQELKRRADASGVHTLLIDKKQLSEIEPQAATHEQALYSPETAVIRPREVLKSLSEELTHSGRAKIVYKTSCIGFRGSRSALSTQGLVQFKWVINAAGTYADRVAHSMGLALDYKILPFKGTYKRLVKSRSNLVRGNIYPVPDLRNPFLGVHFTKNADGDVYIGPTAIPALGRENYRPLEGLGLESATIMYRNFILLFKNQAYRAAAQSEPKKYFKRFIYNEARQLIPQLRMTDLEDSPKVGIRPQLVHWPTRQLVSDFVVLEDGPSVHVLNAISPAFTSSMAFAQFLVSRILQQKGSHHAVSL